MDRDDYYDLQEVLTCLFKVIELGLLEDPDIYTSSVLEKGKLILLPSHMYDTTNYKNYWLGECRSYTSMTSSFLSFSMSILLRKWFLGDLMKDLMVPNSRAVIKLT